MACRSGAEPKLVAKEQHDEVLLHSQADWQRPPFRLFVKLLVTMFVTSVRTKANWDVSPRPPYLVGVLRAADEAARLGISEISVIELGVAGGEGLLALQEIADANGSGDEAPKGCIRFRHGERAPGLGW